MRANALRLRRALCVCAMIGILLTGCAAREETMQQNRPAAVTAAPIKSETVSVTLQETDEAFANPMKGFRPSRYIQDAAFPQGEYVTVCKQYIKYTDLEQNEADTAQKIIDWSNKAWAGIEKRNLKVIPRVVILYPNGPDGGNTGYWPDGIRHDDPVYQWLTDPFKRRLRGFIAKLGEAWDNDPRVAAVELGLWGKWGEHHIAPLQLPGAAGERIPEDFQQAMGDAFAKAFPHKKLLVRYPETFKGYDVGFYWDSFALPDDETSGTRIIARKCWKTDMISGEVAYDWGDQTDLGGSPDGTLKSDAHTDYVMEWVKRTHASSLGWIAEYTKGDAAVEANAARMQKAMGYRFVLNTASFTGALQPGGKLSLEFTVRNAGSAPFYYAWPVEVSLLDKAHRPVWTGIAHVDIRNWHPGYTYTVKDSFVLPRELSQGDYALALAVLDPAGNLPSLRFANTNYYTGGRTPLGVVGIGQNPQSAGLGAFDSLHDDHTLGYSLAASPVLEAKDTQAYQPEPEEVIAAQTDSVQVPGNLAYQKPVTVSSTETQYDNYAPKAVDGDPKTRWSSEWGKDPSWIAVDLGQSYRIDRVNLSWEWSYAKAYEIQVSPDGTNWKTAYATKEGKGNREELHFKPAEGRYVRVFCMKRALQWGYSLYEIEVFEAK